MELLKFIEFQGGYAARTRHNAQSADLTIAFAVDFSTAGERCTKVAAGNRYTCVSMNDMDTVFAARVAYKYMRVSGANVLNVAGNGIYTLAKWHWTQRMVDEYVFKTLQLVHQHLPIARIVSGGQTGVDIAGIAAAYALGIPSVAVMPKGFLQRLENGQDVRSTAANIRQQIVLAADVLKRL